MTELLKTYQEDSFPMEFIRDNPSLLSFEKTPAYIFSAKVAERIQSLIPWTKLIAVLRNPIDRAFSNYKMACLRNRPCKQMNITFEQCVEYDLSQLEEMGVIGPFHKTSNESIHLKIQQQSNQNMTLSQLVNRRNAWEEYVKFRKSKTCPERLCRYVLGRGLYAFQLPYYLDLLQNDTLHSSWREKLLVLKSEDLRPGNNNKVNLTAVTKFLGIHEMNFTEDEIIHNHDKKLDKQGYDLKLTDELRRKLQKFYQPYNALLYSLLGDGWENIWGYEGGMSS